jgi:hypothetical protein
MVRIRKHWKQRKSEFRTSSTNRGASKRKSIKRKDWLDRMMREPDKFTIKSKYSGQECGICKTKHINAGDKVITYMQSLCHIDCITDYWKAKKHKAE